MKSLFRAFFAFGIAAFLLATQPLAPQKAFADDPNGVPGAPNVDVVNRHLMPLGNAQRQTLQGSAVDNSCRFKMPEIAVKPGEAARVMQRVSINHATCRMVVETGTRLSPTAQPTGGTSVTMGTKAASASSRPNAGGGATTLSFLNGTAYHRVWWEDIVGLDVNEVRAQLNFWWDGSCSYWGWGNVYYWWQSGTGWGKIWSGESSSSACVYQRMTGNADYKNGYFCAGFDTWIFYRGVNIYGFYNGNISGTVDSTWVQEPFFCPPLHWTREVGWQ